MGLPKDPKKLELWRKRQSEVMKKVKGTPEARKANSEAQKKRFSDPEYRIRFSGIQMKAKSNPDFRKRASEKTKKYYAEHPEAGKKHSEFMKKHIAEHPELKENHSRTMKMYYARPDIKEWHSKSRTKFFEEHPEARKKLSDIVRKYFSDKWWMGNVTYRRSNIYCEKWKDVNFRVKAFFNYTCMLCGAIIPAEANTRNRHLVGHHVFYEKKTCCVMNEDGIYYTNLNAQDHKSKDYLIGENPNYFVVLCNTCHSKTNGKYETRKRYADLFRYIIDEQYGGKCYYTKEEWKTIK